MLARQPVFSTVVITTLTLGISATTAIFHVVDRVVLHPLPYPDPDRIVYVGWHWEHGGNAGALSPRKFTFWRNESQVFDGLATSSTFQELAERVQGYVRSMMPTWRETRPGVETMTVAVMGCVVNGPGESKAANIGISLPGTGESPNCPIYIDGEHVKTLRGTYDELSAAFQRLVDEYVGSRYARKA